jgi:subtilase family serine protease
MRLDSSARASFFFLLAIACVCGLIPGLSAAAAPRRTRVGSAPTIPARAAVTGALAPERELQMTVMLEPRDPAALAEFATAVSTPGSEDFGQSLGVQEFAGRFGAPAASVAAVSAALRGQGLKVGEVAANSLTLPVSGTVAEVESAFETSLKRVEMASGRIAFANTRAPSVPGAIAPDIEGVFGLDNLTPVQPVSGPESLRSGGKATATAATGAAVVASPAQVVTGGPQPCAEAVTAGLEQDSYTYDQLASAYQFPALYGSGDLGAGQTIAVTELGDPHLPSDIAAFQACYGIHSQVTSVPVSGGMPPAEGVGEASLDIETIIGLAPGANIDVYEEEVRSLNAFVEVDSAIVSQDVAKTISNSYGLCEEAMGFAIINAENTLLQEAAVQGQTFLTASGDNGSESCSRIEPEDTELTVLDPASQPFATAVGGTTLTLIGPPATETVWNEEFVGTGGGLSRNWPMPTYQSGAAAGLGVISAESAGSACASAALCREVPDVAGDAGLLGGYTVLNDGEWAAVGGTSAATPLWAALIALVDADPSCRGRDVGFANPALYAIAGGNYAGNFRDITQPSPEGMPGNDVIFGGFEPFRVKPGYDMTTGLGSPVALALASSLCGLVSPVYTVTLGPPAQAAGTVGSPLSLQVTGSDSGSQPLTYTASGLPAGLSINPATGLVSGVPTAPGRSTISVSASDPYTNAGSTSFTLAVKNPPHKPKPKLKVSKAKLGGVSKGKPKLSFALSAIGKENRFTTVTLALPRGLTFAAAGPVLAGGATVDNAHHGKVRDRLKVKKGKLVIKFSSPQKGIALTVRYPALRTEAKFLRKVRSGKAKHVTLTVAAKAKAGTNSTHFKVDVH